MTNRVYFGFVLKDYRKVLYREEDKGTDLSPLRAQKVSGCSPDGFNWGYNGSGPALLALALLLEETTEDEAVALSPAFRSEVVATWPMHLNWVCTAEHIALWLQKARAAR